MKSSLSGGVEGATVLLLGPEANQLAERLRISGYRPLAEGDPEAGEGMVAGASRRPEAIILSPGTECRMTELRGRFGAVPLLLGIAEDSVEGRARCLASGADDFWLPGIGPSDLLMRLRLHLALESGRAPATEVLQLADLLVLPRVRQVRRGQRSVELTSREFQLLELLLRNGGRIVSRERILQEIWADQGGGSSNVIEVYVRYLRQKLEAGGERRLLHTVRGQGYCLSERMPPGEGQA